jgi:solute carrier family 25 S-adenosylmethionine transporter 26
MQAPPGALSKFGQLVPPPGGGRPRWSKRAMLRHGVKYRNKKAVALSLSRAGRELASLYRGVFGAASGAGVIIGTYFAFYSTAKRHLAARVDPVTGEPALSPGAAAFAAGAAAAVGSSVVKVPLAVCIRSVQAGVYPNVFAAASLITKAAGARGLFTGFVPTVLEDVPDMGVKFAVYESLRAAHARLSGGRPPTTAEDLLIGGTAGAAAAAATTPLDVLKTGMMVSAARSPTMAGALASALERGGPRALFAGVGPRALSNGLNSAVFFCFFEAIRGGLVAAGERKKLEEAEEARGGGKPAEAKATRSWGAKKKREAEQTQQQPGLRISLPRLQLLGGARAKPAQLG